MAERRVNQIWNWLPAFRVVAETQHLPTASKEAHLSASALSRAVKLVEEQLDRQLFEPPPVVHPDHAQNDEQNTPLP